MDKINIRKVEVVPYNPDWKQLYQLEVHKIKEIFGKELIKAHHIGSTSVPGLSAKPIIDILLEVKNIETVDVFNDEMIKSGFDPKGENGIAGRRYFQKGGNNRTHHVHTYQKGNPEIDRHLIFRDYLIEHPDEALEYGAIKEQLAKQYPTDIESYINGKDEFVKDIEGKAIEWAKTALK